RGGDVEGRLLVPVDLACFERGRGGGGIRDVSPHHPVEVDLLAPGRAARSVVARHVVRIPDVDDLVAGLPFVLHEAEWSRADRLLDLLAVRRGSDTRGHDEWNVARRLAERFENQSE